MNDNLENDNIDIYAENDNNENNNANDDGGFAPFQGQGIPVGGN